MVESADLQCLLFRCYRTSNALQGLLSCFQHNVICLTLATGLRDCLTGCCGVWLSQHAFDFDDSSIDFLFQESQADVFAFSKVDSLRVSEQLLHQSVSYSINIITHKVPFIQFYQTNNNMSQSRLSNSRETAIGLEKSVHIPKTNDAKNQLFRRIDRYIDTLRYTEGNEEKIEILNLRKKLIGKYGLSVERIDNLEKIFLHYCSHIFKTGKHMTFERLQYEKSHLTMDRFFVFLKDFSLTTAVIDGTTRQILDKNELILLFKRISINCKDLNFQQFVACIQKIGILYYDSKLHYKQKQEKLAAERRRRKDHYLKSVKRRQAAMQSAQRKLKGQQGENDNQDKLTSHLEQNQELDLEEEKEEKAEKVKDNDIMITEPVNDKEVEQPEHKSKIEQKEGKEDVEHEEEQPQQKSEKQDIVQELKKPEIQEQSPHIEPEFDTSSFQLLNLSPEQKIQYFFQLINVDNAVSFKKKMRQLNLPLFQTKSTHRRATSHVQISSTHSAIKEIRMPQSTPQEQLRLQELRQVIQERKERNKNISLHISKEDYSERRKKRKMEELQILTKRLPRQKKIEVNDLETDLSSLSKMEFDKINFKKFNPQKLLNPSCQQDDLYLQQYNSTRNPQRSQRRIMSTFQQTNKNSQYLLDKLKKRAKQVQSRQRLQQSKYSIAQEVNIGTQHQLRKNRLVEKLLKMQKN